MDMRLAFTEFLIAFCAVALADRIPGVLARLTEALGMTRPLAAVGDALAAGSETGWYVYFSRDAVTGEPRVTPVAPPAPAARPRPQRDTRPRLRA